MRQPFGGSRWACPRLAVALLTVLTANALGADDQAQEQPRPHGVRVPVPAAAVRVDDGDTIVIAWGQAEAETVRVLGIDAPETRHVEHDIPFAVQGDRALNGTQV